MIPAPLLNRHTAVAVVVVIVLVVAAAVVPFDVALPLALAAFGVVQALAVLLVWRTLAPHALPVAGTALLAIGGFLLLALVQLAGLIPGIPAVVLSVALGLAALMLFAGLIGLGVAVLRHRAWTGPTSATLLVAGALVAALAVLWFLGIPLALPVAVWSLVFLGLAVGLRTPREVPDVGLPDTQLGAAKV